MWLRANNVVDMKVTVTWEQSDGVKADDSAWRVRKCWHVHGHLQFNYDEQHRVGFDCQVHFTFSVLLLSTFISFCFNSSCCFCHKLDA